MNAVYLEHADTVYRFLLAKTGSEDLAEELTQETFYQAVKSIDRFDGSCKIGTWLCGIAKNVLLTHLRKEKRGALSLEEVPEPAVGSPEDEIMSEAGREIIFAAIHKLPEPGREIVHLRLLGGLSFRQIGSIFGQSETWARVNYYRAKQITVKELEKNG